MKSGMNANGESLENYYILHMAAASLIDNKERIFGTIMAEYKDKLVIIDGENKKEHEYLIPKIRIDHYGDKRVYFNISENLLKEFEF
jgi:hypothetical protein